MHRPSLILGAGLKITVFIEIVDVTFVLSPSSVDNLQAQDTPTAVIVFTASVIDLTGNIYEEITDATLVLLPSTPAFIIAKDVPPATFILTGAVSDNRAFFNTPTATLILTGTTDVLHAIKSESPQSSWLSFTSLDDFLAFVLAEATSRWRWRTGTAVDSDQALSRWTWQTRAADDAIFPNPENPHLVGATTVDDVVVTRA